MAENDSLGLKLVDAGFDLWMPNARGNRYSRDHMQADNLLFYNSREEYAEYWKFSWDTMAKYDVPAYCEYIFKETG